MPPEARTFDQPRFEALFADVRKLRADMLDMRTHMFRTRFHHIAFGIASIRSLNSELERLSSPRFNLLRIIGLDRREVTTHSAFLAELLRPAGSHAQGDLFLDCFLKELIAALPTTSSFASLAGQAPDWEVDTEVVTGLGNLDLVIRSIQAQVCIVIENKIDAGEQGDQVKRYGIWLEKQPFPDDKKLLLYLTPSGSESQTHGGVQYHRISYHEFVYNWLSACLKLAASRPVKQALHQYLDIIPSL